AHVHAHRVGGAAELGVDRRQRRLGLFLGVVVGTGHRRRVGHQQRLGVGRLVVDRDAHVAEGADDRLDRLGVDQIFRQVVVDLGVGEEAAILALLDQLLGLGARGFALLFGDALAAAELLQQLLFLGAIAALGLGRRDGDALGHLGDDLGLVTLVESLDLSVEQVFGLGAGFGRRGRSPALRALGAPCAPGAPGALRRCPTLFGLCALRALLGLAGRLPRLGLGARELRFRPGDGSGLDLAQRLEQRLLAGGTAGARL